MGDKYTIFSIRRLLNGVTTIYSNTRHNSRRGTVEDIAKEGPKLGALAERHDPGLEIRDYPLRVHRLVRVPPTGPKRGRKRTIFEKKKRKKASAGNSS